MKDQPSPNVFACGSCKFACMARVGGNGLTRLLQCKRNAATPLLVYTNAGPQPATGWPAVKPDDWCWQFEERELSATPNAEDAPEITAKISLS